MGPEAVEPSPANIQAKVEKDPVERNVRIEPSGTSAWRRSTS